MRPRRGRFHLSRPSKGSTVNVGDVIAALEVAEGAGAVASAPTTAPEAPAPKKVAEPVPAPTPTPSPSPETVPTAPAPAPSAPTPTPIVPSLPSAAAEKLSPAVQKMIHENHLDASQISGSGKDGRLIKEDVQNFLKSADSVASQATRNPFYSHGSCSDAACTYSCTRFCNRPRGFGRARAHDQPASQDC